MPFSTTTSHHHLPLLLLLFSTSTLPSSSTPHNRRILHQPIFSSNSPPSPPPLPDYPFSTSTPPNHPFFPNYPPPPPPPPPPSPPSPANISTFNLPPPTKSTSTKLIITTISTILAAIIVLLIALFFNFKKRRNRAENSDTKTTTSNTTTLYNCNNNSFNTLNNNVTIPKLTRPSQTSSEFLYLGTLVNSHVGLNPNHQNGGRDTYDHPMSLNPHKMDSPELHPLPPLNRQHMMSSGSIENSVPHWLNSDELYSPRSSSRESLNRHQMNSGTRNVEMVSGSIENAVPHWLNTDELYSLGGSGRESLIGIGSGSRRASRPCVDVENLDGRRASSSSSSSYSCSSSVSGSPAHSASSSRSPSISISPKRPIFRPKSPDLEALELSSMSAERLMRGLDMASPKNLNAYDCGDVESHVEMCNSVQQNVLVFNPFFRFSSGLDENVGYSEINGDHAKQNDQVSDLKISYLCDQNEDLPGMISCKLEDNDEHLQESNSRNLIGSAQNVDSPKSVTGLAVRDNEYFREPYLPRSSDVSDHSVESILKLETPVLVPSVKLPPPTSVPQPPPPPPPRTPTKPISGPPMASLRPMVIESPILISPIQLPTQSYNHQRNGASVERSANSDEASERSGETPRPKLKQLHWDKVRASSDREMVWDQLRSSSFKLNEEMIESLFIVKPPNLNPAETAQENRVLDPKKSQNIAILLKALHVTVDEVCESLLEGNVETLGTDLLESLLKMAPTIEEENKLRDHKDDSPIQLGPAERFLKEVLDIPFAFKRVEAMLYISNFDSEVEYLRKSFETLETASEELRNSRMFMKLLEAVLKTGNRMNVGTNRGDAHAFKLDTLLKLVDIKGADGKTTLLHFVVQEITRSEGARISPSNPNKTFTTNDDVKCRKLGLQVVSSLASDLTNVKKAAAMDSEILNSDVMKLSKGLEKIVEVIRLNETTGSDQSSSNKFSEAMNRFMKIAEEEIIRIQAQESVALTLVKEITEYFHGNSVKEEAHPFRIFMVVRDFISVLERVCNEVGMINEKTIVSCAHKFPVPVNPMLQPVSSRFPGRRQYSSSDDESPIS